MDMCLEFHYLYRDSGNFKKYGFVDFLVSQIPDLFSELEFVKSHLVDGLYFDPKDFLVPELYFAPFDRDLDHDWHEFSHLEWLQDGYGVVEWEDWKKSVERVGLSLVG
jgi:hypothetical protein